MHLPLAHNSSWSSSTCPLSESPALDTYACSSAARSSWVLTRSRELDARAVTPAFNRPAGTLIRHRKLIRNRTLQAPMINGGHHVPKKTSLCVCSPPDGTCAALVATAGCACTSQYSPPRIRAHVHMHIAHACARAGALAGCSTRKQYPLQLARGDNDSSLQAAFDGSSSVP
jgi:hypothetical protein